MRKKLIVRGPVLTSSGYGEQARFALRTLKAYEDFFDIYISPINWGRTSWVWEDTEERRWIDDMISKTTIHQSQGGQYDISLQITIPNEWERIAPINIGYTAGIETTKIAGEWIQKANMMDKIIVVSNHAKYGFENTVYSAENKDTGEVVENFKCTTPIQTVNYSVRDVEAKELNIDLDYDFNFLVMAQWSVRKNIENTIVWFLEEFKDDEVGLVLKVNTSNNCNMDKEVTRRRIKELTSAFKDKKCKVYFLHGGMSEEELFGLYKHPKIKALINLAHGEGFGLPMFEAVYNDVPVIAPGWSGHCDFLYAPKKDKKTKKVRNFPHFAKVEYDLSPVQEQAVWDKVLIPESTWCYPKEKSYKSKIRNVYNDYGRYESLTKKLKEHIKEKFAEEEIYRQFAEAVYGKELKRNAKYIFVNDLFSDQYLGGAELSLEALASFSEEESIKINSKEVSEALIKLYADKTWVIGNYAGLEQDTISALLDNGVKYNVVEFDFKFCKYRNLELHQLMEGKECDCEYSEHGEAVKDFLYNANKIFFMSERQKETHLDKLSLEEEKCVVLSSAFTDKTLANIKQLREKHLDKKQNFWAISASPNWVKGAESAKNWCHENNVDFVELNNMPYEETLEVLAKAKGVCLLPPGADTCPRLIIEAKLLGCELHYNDNVQHVDEEWFSTDNIDSVETYLKTCKERFWNNL